MLTYTEVGEEHFGVTMTKKKNNNYSNLRKEGYILAHGFRLLGLWLLRQPRNRKEGHSSRKAWCRMSESKTDRRQRVTGSGSRYHTAKNLPP